MLAASVVSTLIRPLQEGGKAADDTNLLAPHAGLMFWTLIIFVVLFFTLAKFAFGPITKLVEAREKSLEDAIAAAKRDRDDATKTLADAKANLDAARAEGQKFIADARVTADKMRAELLDETKKQQDELLSRAKRDIANEKVKAIAELRSEAIDLALKGAGRVIEKNLDDATNRKLVEDFLKTVGKA